MPVLKSAVKKIKKNCPFFQLFKYVLFLQQNSFEKEGFEYELINMHLDHKYIVT
jgi:hypothetical protein